ncbi:hypothetical protein N9166_01550 [bacterium]|nr:hypothetical protein [bacterium]
MPTPSVVQAPTTYNYVSSLDLVQNLHKPEIDSEFVRRYGDQNITGFMEMQGYMNPVSAIEYSHYEDDWLHETVKVASQSAAGGSGEVTFVINTTPPSNVFTTNAPNSPYISTATESFVTPRVQDIVMFSDRTLGLVTAVDPATPNFVVYPLDAGTAIPTTSTADEIVIIGNAHAEQSGQPNSRNGRVNLYTNNLMIKKSTNTVSGTEAGVQTWIEVPDKNGRMGYLWYFESGYQEYRRFMNECEMTMLLGEKITNTGLANLAGQETVTVTEGLLPFIENNGNTVGYSSITGFTLADLDNAVKTLDREKGAKENTIWAGINLSLGMDDTFMNLMQDGAISYGAFSGSQEKAIDLQFSSFKRGNYQFHKKTYDLFNDQKTLGAVGQEFPDIAMVIPVGNVAEGKTKMMVPSLRMNYLEGKGNGYSRDMEEWLTGGANGVYNTATDEINMHYRAHRGFEGFAGNRFLKFAKQ